ncbi:MAG: hypothetical protein EXS31_12835 [Pedosphaera sp.]|nr:hypothetical protein [Pedosphaera sp.]
MKRHLYNSKLGKVSWFVKRFGLAEVVLKPVRVLFAPVIIPFLSREFFSYHGRQLELFHHRYNMTWASERCVEVPVARFYLEQHAGGRILEVGNVLSHYSPIDHEVLDKFEKGPGVINEDVVLFAPADKYDLILSISTFEHIGFDDDSTSASAPKILAALAACRKLLKPSGRVIITVPIGYNLELDELIRTGTLGATRKTFLKKTGSKLWLSVDQGTALECKYKEPFPYANAILVAEFDALSVENSSSERTAP